MEEEEPVAEPEAELDGEDELELDTDCEIVPDTVCEPESELLGELLGEKLNVGELEPDPLTEDEPLVVAEGELLSEVEPEA